MTNNIKLWASLNNIFFTSYHILRSFYPLPDRQGDRGGVEGSRSGPDCLPVLVRLHAAFPAS